MILIVHAQHPKKKKNLILDPCVQPQKDKTTAQNAQYQPS